MALPFVLQYRQAFRFASSTMPLEAGTIIFSESPILMQPLTKHSDRWCALCLRNCEQRKHQVQKCHKCQSTVVLCSYCSSDAVLNTHSKMKCEVIQQIKFLLADDDIDDAAMIVQAYLLDQEKLEIINKLTDSGTLNQHEENMVQIIHRAIRQAVSTTNKELQQRISLDQTSKMYRIIRCNAMAIISVIEEIKYVRGYALYPQTASTFNHSCLPNVARVDELSDDGHHSLDIQIVTMRDIPYAAELCLSYVTLTDPLELRREKLQAEYGFTCECERCQLETNMELTSAVEDDENIQNEDNENRLTEVALFVMKYSCNRPLKSPHIETECASDMDIAKHAESDEDDENVCGGTMVALPDDSNHSLRCNTCGYVRSNNEFLQMVDEFFNS